VLEDELNSGVEEEMRAALDDLADDQLAEALALAWVGAAPTMSASGKTASPRRPTPIPESSIDELMDMPLARLAPRGRLSAFDY
jgi:hypothetical protein